jgi:uncharacterized OB-fold protein
MGETLSPLRNDLSEPFWEGAEAGRLILPYCRETGRPFWPPSPSSPFVTAGPIDWREADPEGVMVTAVTYRRLFQKALADRLPYGIALVELAGGVRLQAHVAEPDAADAPRAGDTVRLRFAPLADGELPVLHVGAPAGGGRHG